MFGKAKYIEVLPPTKIVYTQIFVDKDGKIFRHPMAPTWPEEMNTTVIFFEEGLDQTRVTMEWVVFSPATPAEQNTFKSVKVGMTKGWTGSFDKLEEYLQMELSHSN